MEPPLDNHFPVCQFFGMEVSCVNIFSNYWLSEVYVFNRNAIGYWLLAFGFLANSQQLRAKSQ